MASGSQFPNQGQNPSGITGDADDIIPSSGSSGLGTEGTSQQTATATQGENHFPYVQNHAQGIFMVPVCQYYNNLYPYSGTPIPVNFGAGTSTGQPTMYFAYHYPQIPYAVNQFNPFLRPIPWTRHMDQYTFHHNRSGEIMKGQWNQVRGQVVAELEPQENLNRMQQVLESGDDEQKLEVISVLERSIFALMTNIRTQSLFFSLVDACNDEQFNSIVGHVLSQSQSFVNAALCSEGAISIVKLIRSREWLHGHAFAVTHILSNRFFEIMTHPTAKTVVRACLNAFGSQVNQVLYEQAIKHFKDLAVNNIGCLSLRDCINMISGKKREMLLHEVVEEAAYLSNHPFGTRVVHHLLDLKDSRISEEIIKCLKGGFERLSVNKGGSRIVEKCMDSRLGLKSVVEEIVQTPEAPRLLAKDQFGNYIIQKALKQTKERGLDDLYRALVKFLEPSYKELRKTKGGQNIVALLR